MYSTTPQSKLTIASLWRLEKIILDTLDFNQVVQKITNSVLTELDYLELGHRIVVLALIDETTSTLKRVSISQTEEATKALTASPIPFHEIDIPLSALENFCIKALNENKPYITHSWNDILQPAYTESDSKKIQEIVGIKTSIVYPISYHGKTRGVLIFSMIKSEDEVSEDERDLINGYTDIVGIAVQNAKLYSNLEQTTNNLNNANIQLTNLTKIKDEFVYLASHELRTPLTAIKSYAWMALNGKGEPLGEKNKKFLDVVYSSTERLIHLVSDMLDLSRIESGKTQLKPEPVNIGDLLLSLKQEFLARALEKQLSVDTSYPENTVINADKDKLLQILENLVGNSLKFTAAGGWIKVDVSQKDKFLEFKVSDNGKGIADDDKSKLFAKFGRLDNSLVTTPESGTGLGLYITKQYVELHGGQISFESTFGVGTTFTFTIPTS